MCERGLKGFQWDYSLAVKRPKNLCLTRKNWKILTVSKKRVSYRKQKFSHESESVKI